MKKLFLPFVIAIVGITFTACKKSSPSAPANTASVMFVNGSAGTTNVDVTVGTTKLTSASNLAFAKSSGYQNVTAGSSVAFAFGLTSTGTPLINNTETLTAGTHYSVFVGGLITGPSFVFTSDDLTTPISGNAKVRFVNLSSDNFSENVYIGSVKIDSNLDYQGCTPFFYIPAATSTTVLFQDPSNPTYFTQLSAQQFSSGKIYTIMLTGTKTGTLSSALTLTVIPNN